MATERASRAQVIDVIKKASAALRAARTTPEDVGAVSRALADACGALNLSPIDFDAAIGADSDLGELKAQALREALAGSTDPGPNDAISRVASTGRVGDTANAHGTPDAEGEMP